MFRITEDPSSGRMYSAWLKINKNDSIVSVDMDKFGVMAAYCDQLCVCVVNCTYILCISWIVKCLMTVYTYCLLICCFL